MAFAVFEDVADHIVEPPSVRQIGADGRSEDEAVLARILLMIEAVPGVGFFRFEVRAPRVGSFRPGAGGRFPLVDGRKATADPFTIGAGVFTGDLGDGVLEQFIRIGTIGAEGVAPVCAVHVLPLPFGTSLAADEAPAVAFSTGFVASGRDEGRELGVGGFRVGDEKPGRFEGVGRVQLMPGFSECVGACRNFDQRVIMTDFSAKCGGS